MTSEPSKRPSVTESKDTAIPRSNPSKQDSRKTVSSDTIQQERLVQYDQVVAGCRDLFDEKNFQYKDSISRTGVLGSVVAIAGLSARLEGLVLSAPDAGESNEEAIVDVVKDIINYGVITGIMIMDNNWKP